MASLHRLDCVHNLGASLTKCGCTTKRRASDGKPFYTGKGGLKRIEIICGFPFFGHDNFYTP